MMGRRGFTLLELTVALLAAGLAVAGAHALLGALRQVAARAEAQRADVLRPAAARATLQEWLRSAVLVVETHGPPTFVMSDGGPLRPGPWQVHLWIGREPPRAGALWATLTPLSHGPAARPETLLVAPGATGIRGRYLVMADGRAQWTTFDQPDTTRTFSAPQAIEVLLDGELPPLLRLPIVVPLGSEGR